MEPDRVRQQLDRILAGAVFAGANRSKGFLCFIVDQALNGRTAEIKESVIAVEVFGRTADFDPRTDPIVRAEAARLRSRLDEYYRTEGRADSVHVSVPKGGYAPQFSEQPANPGPGSTNPTRSRTLLLVVAGGVLVIASVALVALRRPADNRETLRVSVLPPRGGSIDVSVLSPDGKRIAFTAVAEGKKKLWVRELNSTEARELPGTDDASFPFWSPDSLSLGFFSKSELRLIAVSGGPAAKIADARIAMGGGWSSTGAIVFPPWPSGGLFRVPAGGGSNPEPATALDAAHDESAHRFPVFLPDGRHFLFFAVSSRPGESAIRVGSLDSTASKRLVPSDGAAVYAPDLAGGRRHGYLLYLYGGKVMAQAFDPERLELSGMPFQAVPDVAERLGRGDISVSTSGTLAYRTAEPKNRQFAWLDRDGRLVRTVGARNSFYDWSLSADEKRIAIQDELRKGSIWVMDVEQGNLSLFATGSKAAFFPNWSSAGDEILFTWNYSPRKGGELEGEIERQALSSTMASAVLGGPGPKFVSDWSSDGRWIAYFTPWPEWNHTNTHIVRVAGARTKLESWPFAPGSHSVSGACFSPDSDHDPRWVAYTSDENGRREVYVGSFPRGERKWVVSTGGGWQPQWRRDGLELFYVDLQGNLMSVEVAPGPTFHPGLPRMLFRAGIQSPSGPPDPGPRNFAVNRNGARFLVNQVVENPESATVTLVVPWVPDSHK